MYSSRVTKDIRALEVSESVDVEIDESEKVYVTLFVTIQGPKDSLYEGRALRLCCVLPKEYPMKSPSIAFKSKVWHPNIESQSGSICLDVLRNRWTPIITLKEVFETYIPQLLLYPEPSDPFNTIAAEQMRVGEYEDFARKYI